MLCGQWSFDATVRGRDWIPETGDSNPRPRTTRELGTPWNINRPEPSQASISILRPSHTQRPESSSARCPTLFLQPNRNTTLNINRQPAQSHIEPIDTKTHHWNGTALQKDKTQLHPSEHRHKSPQQGNLHKALAQLHPRGTDSNIKNCDLPAFRKETPNTVN